MKSKNDLSQKRKMNELLSGVGAIILGLGLGSYFYKYFNHFDLFFIGIGTLSHAIGMYGARQIDKSTTKLPFWTTVAYWLCWALILLLGAFFVFKNY